MLALSEPWAIGVAAVAFVAIALVVWRSLFSREARDRRRRTGNYGKVLSKRQQGPAVQLNLNVSTEERRRKS